MKPFLQIMEREGERNDALHKKMANEQKLALPNLFQDKNRPCGGSWPQVGPSSGVVPSLWGGPLTSVSDRSPLCDWQETSELYIVSQFFVEEWKKFIR